MGATLPLVIKGAEARGGTLGEHLGVLYGSNAIGAIVGTIAAGLYLIPGLGIHRTFLTAATLNLAVGAGALALSGLQPWTTNGAPAVPNTTVNAASTSPTPRQLLVVLGVFTVSGVISLAIEVVWFRVLTLFLRPTVYGFAVMLATILTGIALGSYLVTPLLERRGRWLTVLAGFELAIGIAIVLSFRPLAYFARSLQPAVADAVAHHARLSGFSDCRQSAGDLSDGAADGDGVSDRTARVDAR
jgi:spermidine synthase